MLALFHKYNLTIDKFTVIADYHRFMNGFVGLPFGLPEVKNTAKTTERNKRFEHTIQFAVRVCVCAVYSKREKEIHLTTV